MFSVVTSAIIGAGVGYITNDLALKWMFSGIGPLKPQIAANKEGLGESLGKTVSNRLLPNEEDEARQILLDKLQEDIVSDSIRFAVDDWLKNVLPDYIGDIKFEEIEGFDQTVDGLLNLITDFLSHNAADIMDSIASGIDITTFLTDSQQNYMLDKILTLIAQEMDKKSFQQLIDQMIEENRINCAADILGDKSEDICAQIASECAESIVQEAIKHPNDMIATLRRINLEGAVYTALTPVMDQSLSSLLGNASIESFVDHNRDVVKAIIASKDFHRILTALIDEIINLLHKTDIPLYQIFPINEQNKLSAFVSNKLPEMMPFLKQYLSDKRSDIVSLVDHTVNAVIDGDTSHFFANTMRGLFRDTILQEIEKIDVVNKVEKLAEQFLQSPQPEEECRKMLTDFLKETRVSDVIDLLKQRSVLHTGQISNALYEFCNKYIENIPKEIYQAIGNVQLKQLVDVRKLPLDSWKEKIACWMIGCMKDSPDTCQKAKNYLAQMIHKKALNWIHLPLDQMLTSEMRSHIQQYLRKYRILNWVEKNKRICVSKIKSLIAPVIEGKTLQKLLPMGKIRQASEMLTQKTSTLFHEKVSVLKQVRIVQLLDHLSHSSVSRGFARLLQNAIDPFIKENREVVKKGITNIVAQRISGLDTAEIGNMMSEFMGKEMRPLCKLGAYLGAAVGIIMGVWDLTFGEVLTWKEWIIRLLIFGIIGVATNAIAFWGLFKPYQEKKGIVWRIWKQGYIPSHKAVVARQFGTFVKNELLSSNSIDKWVQENQKEWSNAIPKNILKNDCAMLCRVMQQKNRSISEGLSHILIEQLELHTDEVSNFLMRELGQVKIEEIIPSGITEGAAQRLFANIRYHPEQLNKELVQMLQINRTVYDIAPSIVSKVTALVSSEIRDVLNKTVAPYLDVESVYKLAKDYDLYQKYRHQPMNQLVLHLTKEDPVPQFSEKMAKYILDKIFSADAIDLINNKITDLLSQKFDKTKTIATIIDGQLCNFLNHNISSMTEHIISAVQEKIKLLKYDIQRDINREVHQSVGLLERAAIDSDNLVNHIVADLVDDALPNFFKREIHALEKMVNTFFEKEIYPTKISDIQLDMKKMNLSAVVYDTLRNNQLKAQLSAPVNRLSEQILHVVLNQPLEVFGEIIHINSLKDLVERFESQIKILLQELRNMICANENTATAVSKYVCALVTQSVLKVPVVEFTKRISDADLLFTADNVTRFLLGQKALQKYVQELIEQVYARSCEDRIGNYIDTVSAENAIEKILMDTDLIHPLLAEQCDLAMRYFISDHFSSIDPSTREQIVNWLVASGMQTTVKHLQSLFEAIQIDCIVERIVLDMDGKSIDEMFSEFAKPYFNRLILFGGIGASIVIAEFSLAQLIHLIAQNNMDALSTVDGALSMLVLVYAVYKICSIKKS